MSDPKASDRFLEQSTRALKENNLDLTEIIDAAVKTGIVVEEKVDALTKAQLDTLINSIEAM